MDISVKHGEVLRFSQQLQQWAQSLASTRQNILITAQQLEAQWQDPQYRAFVDTTKNHAATLQASIALFEVMSVELAKIARDHEETQRRAQAGIQGMIR